MTRLIDADETLNNIIERHCKECMSRKGMNNGKLRVLYDIGDAPCRACLIDDMKAMIDDAPTADAVPVRHGKWIPCAKSGMVITELMRKEGLRWYGFKCSACNYIRKGNALTEATYCENCGAKMDGEEE